MRDANGSSDFTVDVPDIGTFTFGRRTQQDKYRIRSVYSKLSDNNYNADGTAGDMEAWIHATLSVLTVEFPDGFSLENLDPFDDTVPVKLEKIFLSLRDKELSFRKGIATTGTGSGPGTNP